MFSKHFARSRMFSKRSTLSAITLAAACTLSAPAMAAGPQAAPSSPQQQAQSNPQLQKLKELRSEAKSLAQKLGKIRQEAVQNNQDLQSQQNQFRDNMTAAMEKEGYDADADYQRLMEIQKELQQGGKGMERKQRMSLVQEFRQKQMTLQKAQQKAMQDEALQKERQALIEATRAAMKDHDPKAKELIQRFEEVRQEMQKLRQAAFSSMQKQAPAQSQN